MAEYLNWREILQAYPELESLGEQQQEKRNHINCPAGRDTKSRLFIKRDGERLIGYCHHCQLSGVHGAGRRNYIRTRNNTVTDRPIRLPADLCLHPDDCHVKFNVWMGKYGITAAERQEFMLGWSPSLKRGIIPVYMNEGLVAYQERRILDEDDGPKYLTTRSKRVKHPMFQCGQYIEGGTMVLTEDILSAVKVGRVANATALMGTHLPDESLSYILRNKPDKVLIWLDDDNPTVRASQRKILRRIGAFVECHRVLGIGRDPKELSNDELTEVIYDRHT